MKNRNLYIISSVLLIIVFILASCTSKQTTEHNHSDTEYYTCPMHPTVVQDEEGDCPICGMDLVLEKGDKSENKKTTGSITIDPTVVQNMGVRVKHVGYFSHYSNYRKS